MVTALEIKSLPKLLIVVAVNILLIVHCLNLFIYTYLLLFLIRSFSIGDRNSNYRLSVSGYSGNAGKC